MKVIKQSVELFPECEPDELSVAKHLEKVARTCYKSEDKITDESAFKFINGLVKNRHLAMLEHYIITCEVDKSVYDDIIWYRSKLDNINKGYDLKYLRLTYSRNRYLVSGSLTTFFKLYLDYCNADNNEFTCLTRNDHFETFLYKLISKYYSNIFKGEIKYPFDCYILRDEFRILNPVSLRNNLDKETYLIHNFRTIKFITDRAIANEIVRSRTASYAQESSRYCVAGDMKLTFKNPHNNYTIEELYHVIKRSKNGSWKRLKIRQYDEDLGELTYAKIKNIYKMGNKKCITIKTKLGYSITCTPDHKILTEKKYKKAGKLEIGDIIMINGTDKLYKNKDWLYYQNIILNKTFVEIAKEFDFNVSTLKKWARKLDIPKKGTGYFNVGHEAWNKGKQIDSQINALKKYHHNNGDKKHILKYDTSVYRKHKKSSCEICGTKKELEVHHINYNHYDNNPSNLITLCESCHQRIHSQNLLTAYADEIISITDAGILSVYDIEMASEYHNFVANGVIVHNCNYSNNKFGSEITIIEPSAFWTSSNEKYKAFMDACEDAEAKYMELIKLGAKPEEARCILPHAVKTELIMTCRLQELNMFLKLRSGERVHPQLKELVYDLINLYGYSF